ncbi:hypothetical protein PHJA_000960900 [Phtheirospermum japonicum]|uniref:Uncharacterized protein n=1 Tax=Phtheirospermum japonicum TaxID=374723 RepID=A0A830BQ32_9LAMI|nr:hypothetical protein PHJA_000960900 [Phtheirospermum japonicum]
MWAAASLQPPKPWSPNTISTTRPPLRRRSVVVNNNIRNREEKMGGGDLGLAQAVITALKSSGPPQQNLDAAKSKTKTIPSGADVLKALERATAQDAKRKKDKKMETRAVSKKGENQGAPCNFDNVRPLCIKPEWGDRLEELERRLQQLAYR